MRIGRTKMIQCAFSICVLVASAACCSAQPVTYMISGPSNGTVGTFVVSLEQNVEIDGFTCVLDTTASITLPIVGEGFEISNVQAIEPTDFAGVTASGVSWSRNFDGIDVSEISGDLFTFDVNFTKGSTGGSYTVGSTASTGTFLIFCMSDTFPSFGGDGVYFDNLGGVTFSQSLLGDINQDGVVDLLDVNPFVQLILNSEFQAEADLNGDGVVDLLDIAGFVELLIG